MQKHINNLIDDIKHNRFKLTYSLGLAAIQRTEESLSMQICSAKCTGHKVQYDIPAFYNRKAAKFLVNALVATLSQDTVISRMWLKNAEAADGQVERAFRFPNIASHIKHEAFLKISDLNQKDTDPEVADLAKNLSFCAAWVRADFAVSCTEFGIEFSVFSFEGPANALVLLLSKAICWLKLLNATL